jgi:predicted deacetylase
MIGNRVLRPLEWLPCKKKAAVCFTIDDLHPGKSTDAYEAGGDLGRGTLRHVEWLLERHPCLHVTLFVTADWREISPFPTRSVLAKIHGLRDHVYLTRVRPRGTMRLGGHPDFIAYLKSLPRTDCALHGLYHVNTGICPVEEYKGKRRKECERNLRETIAIFTEAELPYSPGMCPPSWGLSDDLAEAMISVGLRFVASARDIRTPIAPDAVNSMSGRKGVSIFYPEKIMEGRLLHFPTNFQATSAVERAHQIVELNGLVAMKAHIVKEAFGFIQLDGLDEAYRDYLHRIFVDLEDRYGDDLWWTSMAEITARCST